MIELNKLEGVIRGEVISLRADGDCVAILVEVKGVDASNEYCIYAAKQDFINIPWNMLYKEVALRVTIFLPDCKFYFSGLEEEVEKTI